jgi:lysophospholipase L1-like esterase
MARTDDRNRHTTPHRRDFLLAGAGLTAAGIAALSAIDAAAADEGTLSISLGKQSLIAPGQTILFQGDSITDAGRKKGDPAVNSQPALGNGYAWLAAAQLLVERPSEDLKIYNRGISGNKVYQLAERWQADCLDLKPDVLSVLIGVNDYWHTMKHGYTGTLEKYESDYRSLLQRTKDALPNVKLIVCEPFVLKADEIDDAWIANFEGYREAARHVAESVDAVFVPFQSMFDLAVKVAPPARWAADGVHPSNDGSALMASWWLQSVGA